MQPSVNFCQARKFENKDIKEAPELIFLMVGYRLLETAIEKNDTLISALLNVINKGELKLDMHRYFLSGFKNCENTKIVIKEMLEKIMTIQKGDSPSKYKELHRLMQDSQNIWVFLNIKS